MSAVSVRLMQPDDVEGFLNVVSITYNNGNPIEESYLVAKTHRRFVAEHEGSIKGSFNVFRHILGAYCEFRKLFHF